MMTSALKHTLGLMWIATTTIGCSSNAPSGPATCKDAKSAYGVSIDGPQTLYVGGDKSMPWSAFCVNMASDAPKEFVELTQFNATGAPANFSSFTEIHDDSATTLGFEVTTQYAKVQIDPVDLTIDITNKSFTYVQVAPTGVQPISIALNNFAITYMPYATAMQCGAKVGGGSGLLTVDANLDLSGLPFELDESQLCPSIGGSIATADLAQPSKIVNFHAVGASTAQGMTCGRASVRCLPDPTANGQVGGQAAIHLRYVEPAVKSGH